MILLYRDGIGQKCQWWRAVAALSLGSSEPGRIGWQTAKRGGHGCFLFSEAFLGEVMSVSICVKSPVRYRWVSWYGLTRLVWFEFSNLKLVALSLSHGSAWVLWTDVGFIGLVASVCIGRLLAGGCPLLCIWLLALPRREHGIPCPQRKQWGTLFSGLQNQTTLLETLKLFSGQEMPGEGLRLYTLLLVLQGQLVDQHMRQDVGLDGPWVWSSRLFLYDYQLQYTQSYYLANKHRKGPLKETKLESPQGYNRTNELSLGWDSVNCIERIVPGTCHSFFFLVLGQGDSRKAALSIIPIALYRGQDDRQCLSHSFFSCL